jgi:hypothetical protein
MPASETKKKSHGAKYGKYSGWSIMVTPCFAKNLQIKSKLLAGALS